MLSSKKSEYEIIVTVKKDGEFIMGDRIVSDDIVSLNSQLEFVIEGIRRKLEGKSNL